MLATDGEVRVDIKTLLVHLQRVSGRKYSDDQKQAILHGERPPDCEEEIGRHRSDGDYEQRMLRSQVSKTIGYILYCGFTISAYPSLERG
jgi:hypothetical protein